MLKPVLVVVASLIAVPALAQGIEPGEWEFNAVTTSPLFPKAQNTVFTRCIKKEDAENPERWMARQSQTGECQLTPGERTADSMKWEMACAKGNMKGSGIARITGPGTLESEMQMTGEIHGQRIRLNTKTTGRRLGACKT